MSLNNGFSRNQRVSLSRLENVYCNPFVVESLDYNYTILHGLERLDFDFLEGTREADFACEDFSSDDFFTGNCMIDFSPADFSSQDFH